MATFQSTASMRVISATGEYALRAAVFLAIHHPDARTTNQIVEGTRTPPGYLTKILHTMVRSELICSQRGMHGGFILAREPQLISVLDVLFSAKEGPQRIQKCPMGLEDHTTLCSVHRLLDDVIAHAEKEFARTTLKDLCSMSRGKQPLCECGFKGPKH